MQLGLRVGLPDNIDRLQTLEEIYDGFTDEQIGQLERDFVASRLRDLEQATTPKLDT